MHGIIFSELRNFVEAKLGDGQWNALISDAGLRAKLYLPIGTYPDEELMALVATASKKTGIAPMPLTEAFGEFLAPKLLETYMPLINPAWRSLDMIMHTEATIHEVIRRYNPSATPPRLHCKRIAPKELHLSYQSARRLCGVAKGITRGVGTYYKETLEIRETQCMLQGAASCELVITQV